MFASLALTFVVASGLDFPVLPAPKALADGRSIAGEGKGPERCLQRSRQVLGTWWDGRIRRPVDTATWIGPDMASRWLGYLAERGGWTDAEVGARWIAMRKFLDGRITFVVRLAAFPKLDFLDYGGGAAPRPETLTALRFRLTAGPGGEPFTLITTGRQTAWIEKEDWPAIANRQFFELTPVAHLFLPAGVRDTPDDGIRLGDYYGAVFLVSLPLPSELRSVHQMCLDVFLPSKVEHATFRYGPLSRSERLYYLNRPYG